MAKKRVIDKRVRGKFIIDDDYLNGMAKLVGHQGTLVYMSLCRHANKQQECFPSMKLMAEQHGVSSKTIQRGLIKLEERNVVAVGKTRRNDGTWLNNSYTLIDKSEWNYTQWTNSPVDNHPVDTLSSGQKCTHPVDKKVPIQWTNSPTKETHIRKHIEGNTLSDQKSQGILINEVLDIFIKKDINANAKSFFKNKTQRKAILTLIENYGVEKVSKMVELLPEINATEFVTTATSPTELLNKWSTIVSQMISKKNKDKSNRLEFI